LYYEQCQELYGREYSTTNAATRGHGSFPGCGGFGCGASFGRGRGHGQNNNSNGGELPECQLCGRKGHTVQKCSKRFDQNFTSEDKSASSTVTSSNEVDTNWYADLGATNHITADLENLTIRDKYLGHDQMHTASGSGMRIDQVHTASGSGMRIDQAGNSVIHTPSCDISLNIILYVPEASKNLISIHRFTHDNHVFLERHP
jgi:hypothetical protein